MGELPRNVPRPPCKCRRPENRPSASARGYGVQHRQLRLIILGQEPVCRMCKKAFATDLDHIDGDVNNLARDNLQPLCHSCHSKKTARQT